MKIILLLLICVTGVYAQRLPEKPTLSLSPSVVAARGSFGQSLAQSLTLSNQTASDFAFEMIANDVLIKDGKRLFIPAGETPHSIAESAVFSMKSGVVKAYSSLTVDVRITIPAQTDVRAMVAIFHGAGDFAKSENSVGISASLGTLLTFQLGSEMKLEAEPVHVTTAGTSSNLGASIWLKNPGTEPYVPEGVAAFLDAGGALVGKARFPAQRLLPGERIEFVAEYPGGLTTGTYRVLCSFRYEDHDLTAETKFTVP